MVLGFDAWQLRNSREIVNAFHEMQKSFSRTPTASRARGPATLLAGIVIGSAFGFLAAHWRFFF